MKVFVTGGTGVVGKAVTERLVRQGWDVRVIGIESEVEIPGAEYIECDILDYDALHQAMDGCQAVVHLAAIPNPMFVPGHRIFAVNAAGTFNVFEAAASQGINRIVQASSINALGCFWGNTDISPRYLPIDEAHPTYTTDPYSFSKEVVEEIGAYYWRRAGISSVALRLPGVWPASRLNDEGRQQRQQEVHAWLDQFAALPEAERQARLAEVRAQVMAYRQQRSVEYPAAKEGLAKTAHSDDPLWRLYMFERFNFWAYIDERDAAQAMEKGLTADYQGSYALFVSASHNSLGYDSQTLARLFFPEVSQGKRSLSGTESLVSIHKARECIGFEPEHLISSG